MTATAVAERTWEPISDFWAADRHFSDLDRQAREWAGVMAAATAALVEIFAEVDARGFCQQFEFRSLEHWASLRCGVSFGHAKRLVAIARSLETLPLVREKFTAGAVSEDQLVEIAKAGVTPFHDRDAADFAAVMTVPQLRKALSFLPEVPAPEQPGACPDDACPTDACPTDACPTDAETADAETAEPETDALEADADATGDEPTPVDPVNASPEPVPDPADQPSAAPADQPSTCREWLQFGPAAHGLWQLHRQLSAEQGAIVEKAIEAGRDREHRDRHGSTPDPNDPPTDISNLDGFLRLVDDALDVADPATRRGKPPSDRYLVNIHLNADGNTNLHLGPRLPSATRDELCCDTDVRAWLHYPDGSIGLGRRARAVSPRLRVVVEHRDGGCIIPGCGSRWRLRVHHILTWLHHGRTDTDNLVCLCPSHHKGVHNGELVITGNPDRGTLIITDRWGRPYQVGTPTPPTDDRLHAATLQATGSPWRAGEKAQWHWIDWTDPTPRKPPPPPTWPPAPPTPTIFDQYDFRHLTAPWTPRRARRSDDGDEDDDDVTYG